MFGDWLAAMRKKLMPSAPSPPAPADSPRSATVSKVPETPAAVPKVFRFRSLTTQADDALRDLVSACDDCDRGRRSAIAVGINPVSLAREVCRDAEILDIEAGRGVVGLVAHVHRQAAGVRNDVHVRRRIGDADVPGHIRGRGQRLVADLTLAEVRVEQWS